MESNEAISDLIKIGIPSLVALAGTISSLVLARLGHKQNIRITKLQHHHNQELERNDRTGQLAKTCAIELSELHDLLINFCTIFSAKIDTLACGEHWGEPEQDLIISHHQKALLSLSKHTHIRSYIMLLGSIELTRTHNLYANLALELINSHTDQLDMNSNKFSKLVNESNSWHANLTKQISDIYLLKPSPGI